MRWMLWLGWLLLVRPAAADGWICRLESSSLQHVDAALPVGGGFLLCGAASSTAGGEPDNLLAGWFTPGVGIHRHICTSVRDVLQAPRLLMQLGGNRWLMAGTRDAGDPGWRFWRKPQAVLVAFDSLGRLEWTRWLDKVTVRGAQPDGQGGVWLAGRTGRKTPHAWLGHFTSEGVCLGESEILQPRGEIRALLRREDGTLLAAGQRGGDSWETAEGWCAAYDEKGRLLWQTGTGHPGDDFRCLAELDGDIWCAGGRIGRTNGAGFPVVQRFLARFSSQGELQDSLCEDSKSLSMINALVARDGLLTGTGFQISAVDDPDRFFHATLWQWDADGRPLWTKELMGNEFAWGKALLALPDGWLVAGMERTLRQDPPHGLLIKTDREGRTEPGWGRSRRADDPPDKNSDPFQRKRQEPRRPQS